MQLDKNRIAIRERDYLDVLDLSLRVVRTYALPLAAALAVGIVPAMALNAWLLHGMLDLDPESSSVSPYVIWMVLLVLWEMPLVTAPATLYLGQALFLERPRASAILRNFFGSLPQMFLYNVLLRAPLIFIPVLWFIPFALRPYLNEVILLERNPLGSQGGRRLSTSRRVRALHAASGGDLLGRAMGGAAVAATLVLSFFASLWMLAGMLLNLWELNGPAIRLLFPLSLWLVAGLFVVVRFLSYLDLRIRREGWELELMMRAEGARLAKPSL